MSYDSSNLTTPDIKWLGVRPSDLDRFAIPQQCRLPMTEEDIKTGRKLVSRVVVAAVCSCFSCCYFLVLGGRCLCVLTCPVSKLPPLRCAALCLPACLPACSWRRSVCARAPPCLY
jgi:hypothetical protein